MEKLRLSRQNIFALYGAHPLIASVAILSSYITLPPPQNIKIQVMLKTRPTTRELAHIRQLCCLGLGMANILPDLQKAFHKVLPHAVNCYTWLDDNAVPIQGRMDVCLPEHMDLFFNEFQNLLRTYDPELPDVRIPVFARHGKTLGNLINVPKAFYKTDFYNVLLRPFRFHKMLDAVVKQLAQPIGLVCFFRELAAPPYSQADKDIVAALLPYLAHAEQTRPDLSTLDYCDNACSGLIIASKNGAMSHISERAREILYWSLLEDCPQGGRRRHWRAMLESLVKDLCTSLTQIFSGPASNSLPSRTFHCRYGPVVCKAYWLDDIRASDEGLIAIHVEWKKPKPLLVLENAKNLGLSPRQSELCLNIGMGRGKNDICHAMGIKYNTYKEYVADIYQRLDINSRDQLLQYLLAPVTTY